MNDFKRALHIKKLVPMLPLKFYPQGKIKLLRFLEEGDTIVLPHTQTLLLWTKNLRINLERWLSLYRFQPVIAHKCNESENIEDLEKFCEQLSVHFYTIPKK